MKIRKGDTVKILSGKDRGKTGKVKLVLPKKNKVVVSGVNVMKRHKKPINTNDTKSKGIIDFEAPINASKVMLVEIDTNKSTRVGYQVIDNRKVRISKKTGKKLDK